MSDKISYQLDAFDLCKNGYSVRPVDKTDTYHFILKVHYAKRVPSITYAFGLFNDEQLVGIVTYGTSASSTLRNGVAGDIWSENVIELNRLCLKYNKPNEASRLIGGSLRYLPKPTIVISYADTEQKHLGTVYQATNFLYTGLSAKFRDPKVRGLENLHHATYAHGLTNQEVITKYGVENVYFIDRSRKHRYVYIVGTKKQRHAILSSIKYKILEYPTTDSSAAIAKAKGEQP